MIIGITGGTGCGKTTALRAVETLGGMVLDCDAIYHQLLENDNKLLLAIENRFPGTVADNSLDRKKLGRLVFSDPIALSDLNAITHNAICKEVKRRLTNYNGFAAIDAIALFESGLSDICELTVAVTAPLEQRISRLMARDGITEEYARARISAQKDETFFRTRCNYVLENSGDREAFFRKCLAFFKPFAIMNPEDYT